MRAGEPRRVVVTGVGALTPVGNTAEEFWASLLQGRSGIGPITKFDATGYPTRIAGEVRNFDEAKYVDKKESRRLDPYLKYAIATSAMAVEDAALDPKKIDGTRFGVLIGSGIGGITTLIEGEDDAQDEGLRPGVALHDPHAHREHGARPGLDALRRQGPEYRRW